jgi:hypothetical protein
MSEFAEQSELSNQKRDQLTSSDTTFEFTFSAAQRSEIADIVVAAVRTIQMQQCTSSSTTVRSQKSTITEYIKE